MDQQKHIIHFIDELKIGGAQTHLVSMLAEAKKTFGCRHSVVSLFGGGGVENEIRSLGIAVIPLNLQSFITSKKYISAMRAIYQLIRKARPTLIETHLTWSRILVLPAACLARARQRYAFEHGDIYLKGLKWTIANLIAQFFAKKIILCSETLRRWYISEHKVFSAKTLAMHIGVPTSRFISATGFSPQDLGIQNAKFIFCAAGSMGSGVNKRFDVIIEAFAKLHNKNKNFALIICGDGPLRASLENLVREKNISDAVKFLGVRSDIQRIFKSSHVFCHAAPFEPFGMVVVEAMLCGLPVIAPNYGGPSEIVANGETGFLYEPLNVNELAECMEKVSKDPNIGRSMGERAKQDAIKRFNIQDYVSRLYMMYGISERVG